MKYGQYAIAAILGILILCSWQGWVKVPVEAYAALIAIELVLVRRLANMPADESSGDVPVKQSPPTVPPAVTALLALAAAFYLSGCMLHTAPGADPLVVNVERAETLGKSTFDLVLNTDNDNRPFWRTNAPAFHGFCEWLRQPQTVEGTNTLPRAAAMLVSLDDVKLSYQSHGASSNALASALGAFSEIVNQASAWATVVKKPTP